PDSVTSIGDRAFSDCKSLTSVTIPAKFTDEDVKKWDVSSNCKVIRR
ncbi:MAG: leucine-rich repeat protein, partial [Lentisphaeria bacterium]|nr:leucine-rich repeat protein [Lentisphaeria bacterium]